MLLPVPRSLGRRREKSNASSAYVEGRACGHQQKVKAFCTLSFLIVSPMKMVSSFVTKVEGKTDHACQAFNTKTTCKSTRKNSYDFFGLNIQARELKNIKASAKIRSHLIFHVVRSHSPFNSSVRFMQTCHITERGVQSGFNDEHSRLRATAECARAKVVANTRSEWDGAWCCV